jgi:putative peptidoglycan lipid II flippase
LSPAGQRVAKAALLMMATIAVSRILGYGREVALYTMFGQNYMTDAYRAAFSLPDLLYLLLVGGALSSAFIPVFSAGLATGKEAQAWKSASIVFNYTMIGLVFLLIMAYSYTLPLIIPPVHNITSWSLVLFYVHNTHESIFGNFNPPDLFHPLLAFFLFLQ